MSSHIQSCPAISSHVQSCPAMVYSFCRDSTHQRGLPWLLTLLLQRNLRRNDNCRLPRTASDYYYYSHIILHYCFVRGLTLWAPPTNRRSSSFASNSDQLVHRCVLYRKLCLCHRHWKLTLSPLSTVHVVLWLLWLSSTGERWLSLATATERLWEGHTSWKVMT